MLYCTPIGKQVAQYENTFFIVISSKNPTRDLIQSPY
jgi:hypothetical protein